MTNKIWVLPAAGRRVRNPATGVQMEDRPTPITPNPFWDRRLADGDLVRVGRPAEAKPEQPTRRARRGSKGTQA